MSGIAAALAVQYLPQLISAAMDSGIPQEIISGATVELGHLINRGAVSVASETSLASSIQAAAQQDLLPGV
jgi:hypothetical protein